MTGQLLETADEDPYVAVAEHVGRLLNEGQAKTDLADTPGSLFARECKNLLAENKYEEYIRRFIPYLDLVFSKLPEKDVECVISVVLNLIPKVDEKRVTSVAHEFAQAMVAKPTEKADEKLPALVTLYRLCPSPQSQYAAFIDLVEFAKTSKSLAQYLIPLVKGKADDLVKQWKLPEKMATSIYLTLAALFKLVADKGSTKESLKLLTSALRLVKAEDRETMDRMKPYAIQALQEFVRSPDTYTCDFAHLAAVTQLEGDAQYGGLYRLLTAMLAGDLPAYRAAATPAVLSQVDVDANAALTKVRMMALLAAGGRAAKEAVTMEDLQVALDVPAEEVEAWVVRAIGRKLLEGRIDQVSGTLSVTKCTQRTFGPQEWRAVRDQLAAWRDALVGAAHTIADATGAPPPTRQAVRA